MIRGLRAVLVSKAPAVQAVPRVADIPPRVLSPVPGFGAATCFQPAAGVAGGDPVELVAAGLIKGRADEPDGAGGDGHAGEGGEPAGQAWPLLRGSLAV